MHSSENKLRLTIVSIIIFFVTFARIIVPSFLGHLPTFSPVAAMALFSGAYFSRKWFAPFLVMFLSVWVSDLLIDRIALGQWMLFYPGFYWQYGCFFLMTLIGMMLKNRITLFNVSAAGLSSALLFFVISNFGVWMSWTLYPMTKSGLMLCYIAAIPFFKYELLSNLFYCTLLFGSYEWIQRRFLSASFKPAS
jgi:hypothetical protein